MTKQDDGTPAIEGQKPIGEQRKKGLECQLVICKNCGDQHYLNERKHRSASSFCPECRMRGGCVLDGNRKNTPTHPCVYCGDKFTFIADHHREEHPDRRYDPLWYMDDVEADKEPIV